MKFERDKSHDEQVERWAEYVKNNSDWKQKLKPFLDSQIIMARRFCKKLAETPEGMIKLEKIKLLTQAR